MKDVTPSKTDDTDADDGCATCGAAIDASNRHPIAADFGADGEIRIRLFCSQACRDRWNAP
ncbi:DUF7576 family protein [Halegenticoccus tardaugens]|uniref:DUF7576 family protein n=1 Tax=Halegenticoccus tardaugens TaxID=2071624 RepID=UPI00100A3673|nr:hypothetical protein [Halegenticoccus tardaugens]